jgi:hypothetical protein
MEPVESLCFSPRTKEGFLREMNGKAWHEPGGF